MGKSKKRKLTYKKQGFWIKEFFRNCPPLITKVINLAGKKIENYFKVPVHTKARYHLFGVFVVFLVAVLILIFLFKKISYQRKINQLLNYYQFKKEIEVDIEELFSAINDRDKKVLLIDLREKKDFEKCHFKTATNLSINDHDFLNKVNKLMKNKKEIVVYGQRGNDKNNFEAFVKLLSRGKLAKSLSFGWEEWKIIYGRNLFEKGVDLNKYIEPEGCLNYVNSYPGAIGPNFGPMPGFPNGMVPAPIMPGQ